MSTIVTVNPPDVITVTAVTENEFNVTVTEAAPIAVTVSTQSGVPGNTGATGPGVPPGGTIGQRLIKVDSVDFNTQWADQTTTMTNKQIAYVKNGLFVGNEDFIFDEDLQAVSIGNAIFLPDNPLGVSGDIDSYLQINLQNRNSGVSASADMIITADNGEDELHFIDLGMNNSGYDGGESYTAMAPNDGYLLMADGNLIVTTITPGTVIKFCVDGEGATEESVKFEIGPTGIDMKNNMKVSEGGFNLTDLITECASAIEEAAAFAAGSKIVIRTDLI